MLPRLVFLLRLALAAMWRSLGVTTLAIATIGVALAVLATFMIILGNLSRVADELGREVGLSGYLARGTPAPAGERAARAVAEWPEIAAARFLTSEQSMAEFRESLGEDAVLLEGLPADVVQPSVEASLEERAWTTAEVRALAERLGRIEGVVDVRYGQEDVERLEVLLGFARIAALVLGTALCLATILIVSNTIRLTVYTRRDEIEIMSLVGATNAFVRAPFLLEGAIQGFLGGVLSLGALSALEEALRTGLERGLSYAYGPVELDFVPWHFLGYVVAGGALLGLLGSLLAVGRFLRVR